MDKPTEEGVLAHVAFRRVDAMRRRLVETIVMMHWRATGELPTAAQVQPTFAALWVEPTAERLADMVAAKCSAGVDTHHVEMAQAHAEVEVVDAKNARWSSVYAGVAVASAGDAADAVEAKTQLSTEAQALLDRAVSNGGDPTRAPGEGSEAMMRVPAEVDAHVDALIAEGI